MPFAPLLLLFLGYVAARAPFLRDRPRGLGLLQLPTGMTDERSGPFFPNLYIAGDKAGQKPQSVPDIHLPGQEVTFSGRSAFNPFTQAVAAVYNEDLVDSWGAGFAVNAVNNFNLPVRRNFDQFADAPLNRNDGMYQPFLTGLAVGAEYDYSKIREVSGHLDLPVPGVNELFDFDGRIMTKGGGNGILNSAMEFPLTLSDPNERAPYTFKYLNFMADRHMQYGHVVPNVNLFLVGKDKIMDRLVQNRLNPTMIGSPHFHEMTSPWLTCLFSIAAARAPFLRDRPRGLGLLQLPTGMTDERSGPFFPNLYIAGDKAGQKPQSVPDVHLPGQESTFSGRTAFNPFTQAVAAVYNEDLVDSWGSGFAGVNNYNLGVRRNFDQYADSKFDRNDGNYQPFLTAFTVGAEYDYSKIREVSGHLDLPIPGVNELFDFDGRIMLKGGGNGILNSAMEFPLTLSDPNERAPYTFKYLNFMADRHMQYGHVVPNVNLFLVGKDKIMDRLVQNRLNPTMIG